MNTRLIFIASIVCSTFSHVVLTEKYPYIGTCVAENRSYLRFICDRTTFLDNYCDANQYYICLNHHCFYKNQIRKIDFVNCEQPKILNSTFRYFNNVYDLNMSHLGMTVDQMSFLAEPNKLTEIDASNNNIETISSGMLSKIPGRIYFFIS